MRDAPTNPTSVLLPNGTIIVALRRATSATQPLAVGHVDRLSGPWQRIDGTVHATAAGSPHTYEEDPYMYRTDRGWHMLTRRKVAPATPQGKGVPAADEGGGGGTGPDAEHDAGRAGAGVGGTGSCPAACTTPAGCFTPCPDASDPDGLCGGGHLYSLDLKDWFFGEAVYAHSPDAGSQCNVELRAGPTRPRARHGGGAPASVQRMRFTSRQRPTLFTDVDGSRYLYNGVSVNRTMYFHSFTFVQQINVSAN